MAMCDHLNLSFPSAFVACLIAQPFMMQSHFHIVWYGCPVVRGQWPMVSYIMTIVFQVLDYLGFELKPCVITADMNLHDR